MNFATGLSWGSGVGRKEPESLLTIINKTKPKLASFARYASVWKEGSSQSDEQGGQLYRWDNIQTKK